MATDAEGKKLSDLRVVDLRAELEKRGLDKTGVKAALLDRLQKALLSEGKDPDEYEFELNDKKPVKRLSTSTRTEEVDNSTETSANDSNVLMIETPSLEQEADKDGAHEEETKNNEKTVDSKHDNVNAESPLNISIGEEEEFINSGDEHDQSASSLQKDEDEKTAANQSNVDDPKKSDSSTVKPDDDKEDEQNDSAHNVDATDNHEDKTDEDGGSDDAKKDDGSSVGNDATTTTTTTATAATTAASATSTSTVTTTVPSATSNGATVASDKDTSKSDKDATDKDKDKNNKGNPGRSLWVTNLLPSTRAQELKHLLSKYGKVIGAKVVQSSRYPRQRCYGYVTMETRAAADLCIEKLTNTELKGQIIRVAKVRPEHSLPVPMNNKPQKKEDSVEKDKRKKTPPKSSSTTKTSEQRKSPAENKKKETNETTTTSSTTAEKKKDDTTKKDGKEERDRSRKSSRESTGRKRSLTKSSTRVERKSDILTFDKIREERERQRQRERERAMREEEKRRREIARAREIEKRQREEALRLEREREKLRMERDRLDRQRAEIMRLERERQRLEREKLEQERQELRRAQMKLEEARRPVKRPSSSTAANYRRESGGGGGGGGAGAYGDERKRMVTDRHYDETPPPPRFEVTNRDSTADISKSKELPKDYKSRLAYSSKRAEEYPPKRSSGSEFKREYPPADRHSGGHPSHLVHSIGNSASSSKYESSSYVNREREREIREPTRRDTIVPNVPPPRISKDARYAERTGERSPVSYRAVRDERERRQVSDHHSSKGEIRSSRDHRYPEPSMKEGARYREGGNSWHSTPVKPFSNIGGSAASSRDSWNKTDTWRPMETNTNERWGNSSSRMLMSGTSGVPNSIFSGGSSTLGISAGLSCPPPPGNSSYPMDRFESSFKSLNSSRKY